MIILPFGAEVLNNLVSGPSGLCTLQTLIRAKDK